MLSLEKLKNSVDFRKVSSASSKVHSQSFVLLYLRNSELPLQSFGLGLVASKKVGNAVKRNRSKRIMRSLALDLLRLGDFGRYCFVIVAKPALLVQSYQDLKSEFSRCLKLVEKSLQKLK